MLTKELRYDNINIVARLVGQGVKTSPSHGENRSSILLQAAMCPAKAGLFLFLFGFFLETDSFL